MFYKITKKINEILNWIYSKDGYYALKSGLYFDHFFKKVSSKIIKDISFFFGLLFMDTFLINKLFTKFFSNLSELQSKFLNLKKKNNFYSVKYTLVVLLFLLLFVFLFFIYFV